MGLSNYQYRASPFASPVEQETKEPRLNFEEICCLITGKSENILVLDYYPRH